MGGPKHPGEVLRERIGSRDVTTFAAEVGVNRVSMSRLLNGQNGISPQMSLSLSEILGTTPEFWLTLQMQYDLWHAREDRREAAAKQEHITKYVKSIAFKSETRPGRMVRVTKFPSEVTGNKRNQKITHFAETPPFEKGPERPTAN